MEVQNILYILNILNNPYSLFKYHSVILLMISTHMAQQNVTVLKGVVIIYYDSLKSVFYGLNVQLMVGGMKLLGMLEKL